MATKGSIQVGTSGWAYPHWKNLFYPGGLPASRRLEYYASQFNCTEINASFYRLPTLETVENWQQMAGKGFYFCPKISRYVTHAKKLNDPELGVPRFFDVFGAIAKSVGPVLIQLPAIVGFNAEKAKRFFSYLHFRYGDFKFALETRHGSWMEQDAQGLLQKFNVGWVIADSGERFPGAELITAKHVYLRFHGPDGHYATSYGPKSLKGWADKCLHWKEQGHAVWAFFNNDLNGYAVQNALLLKKLIG